MNIIDLFKQKIKPRNKRSQMNTINNNNDIDISHDNKEVQKIRETNANTDIKSMEFENIKCMDEDIMDKNQNEDKRQNSMEPIKEEKWISQENAIEYFRNLKAEEIDHEDIMKFISLELGDLGFHEAVLHSEIVFQKERCDSIKGLLSTLLISAIDNYEAEIQKLDLEIAKLEDNLFYNRALGIKQQKTILIKKRDRLVILQEEHRNVDLDDSENCTRGMIMTYKSGFNKGLLFANKKKE